MSELTLEGFSIEQIEELIEDQETEEGKEALVALLNKRREMDEKLAKAPKRGSRSSAGRKPTDRHLLAVEHFNADPAKLERLKKAIEASRDEVTLEPMLSVELIRIGIGAYYDQRKRDDELKKAGEAPAVPTGTAPVEEALTEAEAEALSTLPDTVAEPLEASEEPQTNWGADDDEDDPSPFE